MSDTRLYRPVPAIPVAPDTAYPVASEALSRTPLEDRVEELDRVVATLATLRNERLLPERPREDRVLDRKDAAALTAALHPSGRAARASNRRSSNDGTMAMRFVFFEPPTSR